MMNPLSRRMFRDPTAGRKPQGILASSAPIMTAAQRAMAKNQPVKAQTGTSVNTRIQAPPQIVYPGYPALDGAITQGLTDDQLQARMMAQRQSDLEAGIGKPMPILQALTEPTLEEGLAKLPTAPGTSRIGRVGDFLTKLAVSTARAPYDVTKQTLSGGSSVYDYLTEPYYTEEDIAAVARQFADAQIGGKGGQPVEDYERGRQEVVGPREVILTEGDFTDTGAGGEAEDIKPVFTNEILSLLDPNGPLSQEEYDLLALSTGKELASQGKKIIDTSLAPKQKATDFDKLFGIEGTYEERVEKRKAFLRNLLGERSKDIRTDLNYNLMMTGLLIAAGESPDAMTNLAKGAAAGLVGYGEAVGEEREAERKEETVIALQAVSEIGEEDARVKALKAQEAIAISAGDVAFERQALIAEQQAQAAKTEAEAQRAFLALQGDKNRLVDVYTAQLAATSKVPTIDKILLDLMATDSFSEATMGMSGQEKLEEAVRQAAQILNLVTPSGGTSGGLLSFATQDEARAALSKMDTLPSQVIIGGQIIPVGTK